MSPLIEAVLWKLGATSVQTAVLVLVVWALCRGVRRLPAATQTWLWWLVGVQALVGLVWSSPVQLPVLPAHHLTTALGSADSLAPMANAAAASTAAHASATAQAMQVSSWPTVAMALLALWAAGVLVLAAGTARAYLRSRALVRAAEPCTDHALVQALQMASEAHGLSRPPALRLSSQIDSPQLIGPWQPVLLLPAARLPHMADDDLDMALTHELIHLRRGDLWWGLLPALAQHLFFFHPLVHLAAREYGIAREAACDAAVVAGHRHCRHEIRPLVAATGCGAAPTRWRGECVALVYQFEAQTVDVAGHPRVSTAGRRDDFGRSSGVRCAAAASGGQAGTGDVSAHAAGCGHCPGSSTRCTRTGHHCRRCSTDDRVACTGAAGRACGSGRPCHARCHRRCAGCRAAA